jgi:hypothetical protein
MPVQYAAPGLAVSPEVSRLKIKPWRGSLDLAKALHHHSH